MNKKIAFEDAQQLAKKYPDTFFAPSQEDLNDIKPGDFIKVCAFNERFWIEVTSVEVGSITGRVDNDLLMTELLYNDIILVEPRHVYEILPARPIPKQVHVQKNGKRFRKGNGKR